MHSLFIPSWYGTPNNSIRGNFVREQALALTRAGHRVGLLVPPDRLRTLHGLRQVHRNWRCPSRDLQIEQDANLTIYRIPWWGWSGSVLRSRRDELALAAFDRYCAEQGRPDVVHGHSLLYGGYVAAIIKTRHGIPAVATEHSSIYISGPVWPDQRPAIQFTIAHLDRLAAVSESLARSLTQHHFRPDIAVLPNIVDTVFFQPVPALPASPFAISLIARLDANKAPELTLRAFAKAFGQGEARLTIAGEGSRRAALRREAANLNLQNNVLFPGWLSREQLRELIQASHIIVSSSHIETFGLTLIEAMACGKPVIATRSGGPDSFVTETTGLLVPTGDVDALAAAMRQMADTYDRYNPAAIRAYCVEHFSETAFVQHVEHLYSEVTPG
jgi:glycosyltransferase involved in cell wall biosynthesis